MNFRLTHRGPSTSHPVVSRGDWTLKPYAITFDPDHPVSERELVADLDVVFGRLASPNPAVMSSGIDWANLPNYGLGFVIVHRGREATFVLLDVWVGENMLWHQTWVDGVNVSQSGISVCVWELAVQAHERVAWIKHIYRATGETPHVDGYLADRISGAV